MHYKDKRVAILGYGVNNAELVPYLQQHGAHVTICDKNSKLPQDLPNVTYRLGDDYLHGLTDFEVLFRTPGLPYHTPEIQAAKQAGAIITSQTQLFLEECKAHTIGVTGTKGKGTTATLIYNCLKRAHDADEIPGQAFLAGNIGASAIGLLDKLQADDWVVLELSSFQLQDLTLSPHIAVVLNITSDHLDHHKDVAEYHDAKKSLVRYQSTDDYVVLFKDSPVTMSFLDDTHATPFFFSRQHEVDMGAYIADEQVMLRLSDHGAHEVCAVKEIKLVGDYNLENVTAATTAAALAGASLDTIKQELTSFTGLAHRMQRVAAKNGVTYFDDSKASTPDSSIAAFLSFHEPVILILGGSSKGADYTELVNKLKDSHVTHVICIGQEGQRLLGLLKDAGAPQQLIEGAKTMPEIVAQTAKIAEPGSVVLLSPAAASFDMFKNAEDRGNQFQAAVKDLHE